MFSENLFIGTVPKAPLQPLFLLERPKYCHPITSKRPISEFKTNYHQKSAVSMTKHEVLHKIRIGRSWRRCFGPGRTCRRTSRCLVRGRRAASCPKKLGSLLLTASRSRSGFGSILSVPEKWGFGQFRDKTLGRGQASMLESRFKLGHLILRL